mmetsp:Transcript_20456/g.46431  ORF Transcript_20456/g.46431 Transcript_20456/m.46431 type:complete len:208 (-) Transcript_20456:107-730(-)
MSMSSQSSSIPSSSSSSSLSEDELEYKPTCLGSIILYLAFFFQLAAWVLSWFSNSNDYQKPNIILPDTDWPAWETILPSIDWPAWAVGMGSIFALQPYWCNMAKAHPASVFHCAFYTCVVAMGLSFGLCGKSTLCIIQGSLWFIVCFLLILYYIIENKNAKLFDREKKKIKEEEEMEKIHVKIAHVSQDLAPSVDAIDTASNLEYWK